jgi:seryl-tRNA synthetase
MLDIRQLRQNPELFQQAFQKRGLDLALTHFLKTDAAYRDISTQLQVLRTEKNQIDTQIKKARLEKTPCEDLFEKANQIKQKETELEKEHVLLAQQFHAEASELPNILSPDVPKGESESDNQEISRWMGERKTPEGSVTAKNHIEIGQFLGGIELEKTVQMSGSRFVILKSVIARLERALIQWMLDMNTETFGYEEVSVPYLVRPEALFVSGQLPKFKNDLFQTTDHRFLIPTGEVPLVNLLANRVLTKEECPVRLTTLSPCFRSEAGSAGKDVYGMIRLHQFHKVELVSATHPENSIQEHEYMIHCIQTLMKKLELPHRIVILCSKDTGFTAAKTYDVEVYVPSEKCFREISSCSSCTDFQARRGNIWVSDGSGQKIHAHTFNGSALPTGRCLVAILEHYYNDNDGSITVPQVLIPYLGGKTRLERMNSI